MDDIFEGIIPPIDFKLSELKPLINKDKISGKSINPSQPILVGKHKDGSLYVSDGNHRYHEAVARGDTTIKGYHEPESDKPLTIKQAYKKASETNESMNDIFANIESNDLEAAREALNASLSAKVSDKLDAMRKEISGVLTKEGLDETFKRYKEPTDLQLVDTHTHGKVQAKVYSGYNRYHVKTVVNGKHYDHLDFSSDNKDEATAHGKKQLSRINNEEVIS